MSELQKLYDADVGKVLKIVSIPPIKILKNLGLRPDTRVVIQNRYIFGGPVLLKVANAYNVALGKDVAQEITVCAANEIVNDNIEQIEKEKAA